MKNTEIDDDILADAAAFDASRADRVKITPTADAVRPLKPSLPEHDNHCKDCCCALSWSALGIDSYTGKSIPEEILKLRLERDALLSALKITLEALHIGTAGRHDTAWIRSVKEQARAAIAQAEGGE